MVRKSRRGPQCSKMPSQEERNWRNPIECHASPLADVGVPKNLQLVQVCGPPDELTNGNCKVEYQNHEVTKANPTLFHSSKPSPHLGNWVVVRGTVVKSQEEFEEPPQREKTGVEAHK